MGKFLRDLFLFLPLATGIYMGCLYVAAHWNMEDVAWNVKYRPGVFVGLWEKVRDSTLYAPHDLLVMGSSLAYRGVDPRIVAKEGYQLFNMGSMAQCPVQTEVLLRRHWPDAKAPVVIFIVTDDLFGQVGFESAIDIVSNDRPDCWNALMVMRTRNVAVLNTAAFAWTKWSLVEDQGKYRKGKLDLARNDRYIPGGYVERSNAVFDADHWAPLADQRPMQVQLRAFERCIQFVRSQGSIPVIVSPPVTRRYWVDPEGAWWPNYWRSLGQYYDFSRLHDGPDDLCFYDGRHQNQHGVDLFSRVLIQALESDGLIGAKVE